MANLTRFDPFRITNRLTSLDPIEDVFRGFFRPVHMEDEPLMQLRMDVKEDDRNFTVHAEIPGVKKEDIQVSIEGNQVSISAETKQEKEVKEGEKVVHSERHYGSVARTFSLASEIDDKRAEAHYRDGVLELILPKKTASSMKKLTID
jgi:HSP20 family protein